MESIEMIRTIDILHDHHPAGYQMKGAVERLFLHPLRAAVRPPVAASILFTHSSSSIFLLISPGPEPSEISIGAFFSVPLAHRALPVVGVNFRLIRFALTPSLWSP